MLTPDRHPSGLVLLRFRASWLEPYTRPSPPGSGSYDRIRGSEALRSVPDAVAALDGSMYDNLARGRADLNYLVSGAGMHDPGDFDSRGITLSVRPDGTTEWRRGARIASGAVTSLQLYPSLVEGGRNVQNPAMDTDANWRAAVVELQSGELAFAVQRTSMHAFADALVRAGATYAGYTDGGGSARLLVEGSGGTAVFGSSEDRAVPLWLMVRPRVLADGSAGSTQVALWFLLALVLAFGAWRYVRTKRLPHVVSA